MTNNHENTMQYDMSITDLSGSHQSNINQNVTTVANIRSYIYARRGLLCTFVAALFFASSSLCIKGLQGSKIGSTEILFFRAVIMLVLSLVVLIYKGIPIRPISKFEVKLFLIQSSLSTISTGSMFYALQHMNVADATAITYAYPGLCGLFGRLFLKEAFGCVEVLIFLFTLCGVVFIGRPPFLFGFVDDNFNKETTDITAVIAAVVACVGLAAASIAIRTMSKRHVFPLKILFYYTVVCSISSAVVISLMHQWVFPSCYSSRLLLLAVGLLSFIANILLLFAYTCENAVYVAIVSMNEVLFVFVLDVIFLGWKPELMSIIGITIIMGSSLLISLRKAMTS